MSAKAPFTVNGKPAHRLPTSVAQPVAPPADVTERVQEYLEKQRLDERFWKFIGSEDAGDTSVSPAQGEMSPAQRRYNRIVAKQSAPVRETVKRIEIDGEEWFIRAWDAVGINRFEMNTSRNSQGVLLMYEPEQMQAFLAALLHCGVVQAPDDLRPVFSLAEAREWVESTIPEIRNTATRLQREVALYNADYFDPEAGAEALRAYEAAGINLNEPDPREKKESSPPSGTLLNSAATDGSPVTASTAEPPLSPSDSTAATEPVDTATAMPL